MGRIFARYTRSKTLQHVTHEKFNETRPDAHHVHFQKLSTESYLRDFWHDPLGIIRPHDLRSSACGCSSSSCGCVCRIPCRWICVGYDLRSTIFRLDVSQTRGCSRSFEVDPR